MAKKDEKTPVKKQKKNKKKSALPTPAPKHFFDLIAPSVAKFSTDHFILGSTYRCVLALRGYPTRRTRDRKSTRLNSSHIH